MYKILNISPYHLLELKLAATFSAVDSTQADLYPEKYSWTTSIDYISLLETLIILFLFVFRTILTISHISVIFYWCLFPPLNCKVYDI